MCRRLALGVGLSLGACAEPAAPSPPAPAPSSGKRVLYGDPALVPTREGEHVRREVAAAGEIEAALRVLPGVEMVHADVELRPDPPRAAISARAGARVETDRLRDEIEAIVVAVVGSEAAITITVSAVPGQAPRRTRLDVPLAFSLLGLGISLGIMGERLARLRRRRA